MTDTALNPPNSPQHQVAQAFMAHKGLGHLRPTSVHRVQAQHIWYFHYVVDEQVLELEVSWDVDQGWNTTVTAFQPQEPVR